MVQVLSPRQRELSFAEKITPAFQNMGESFGHIMGSEVKRSREEKLRQAEALRGQQELQSKQQFEMQKMKEQARSQQMLAQQKAMNDFNKAQTIEEIKQQGKKDLLGQKQAIFGGMFGSQPQEETFESQAALQSPEMQQQPKQKYNPLNIPDEKIAELALIDPSSAREVRAAKDTALREKRAEEEKKTAKEKEYFKINEPKVMELSDTERKLDIENARYNRLQELFSDQSKFPPTFVAGLFSKEGQVNDLLYSQLSPEAQEAIKLIVDSTSGIKDSYGARVTNFDLQTYLKKLPSLLNSPEGKSRVLRDLQIMNRLNHLHAMGIQNVFEDAGGTDKIPFSTAEKIYKKKYGEMEKDLIDQFVTPDKGIFKERPDPQKFLGKKIKDQETGEILISDGTEWKPFKG